MIRPLMTAMSLAAVFVRAGSTEAAPDDQQHVEVELRRASGYARRGI